MLSSTCSQYISREMRMVSSGVNKNSLKIAKGQ